MLRSLLVLAALGLLPTAAGQDDVTLNATTSQSRVHDVRALAMGDAGAFLPDASPLSFMQNPARLAQAAASPMLRVAGHTAQRYYTSEADDVDHLAATATVGAVAVGAVLSRFSTDATITDEQGNEVGNMTLGDVSALVGGAVRIGDARAHLDLGAAGRLTRLRQFTAFDLTEPTPRETQTRPSIDLGAIATYNVLPAARQISVGGFAPAAAVSAGYTQRAIGPRFAFEYQADGLTDTLRLNQPREASIGVSAQLGLDAQYAGGRLRLLALDLAVEATTQLNSIVCDFDEEFDFACIQNDAALVGDIRLRDAVLGTSDDFGVDGQRGARLTLAETVWIAVGELRSGSEDSRYRTGNWGAGLSVGGALRAIGTLQNDSDARTLGERMDLTVGIARVGSALFSGGPAFKLIAVGGAIRL